MTWSEVKDEIKQILADLNYTELADDEQTEDEPSQQHTDKTFMIKSNGNDGLGLTSNASVFSHGVILTVFYSDSDSSNYDKNRDLFNAVIIAIVGQIKFLGETNNSFEEIDELHQKGTFEFYYGMENC